jgi:hypothetical protein
MPGAAEDHRTRARRVLTIFWTGRARRVNVRNAVLASENLRPLGLFRFVRFAPNDVILGGDSPSRKRSFVQLSRAWLDPALLILDKRRGMALFRAQGAHVRKLSCHSSTHPSASASQFRFRPRTGRPFCTCSTKLAIRPRSFLSLMPQKARMSLLACSSFTSVMSASLSDFRGVFARFPPPSKNSWVRC